MVLAAMRGVVLDWVENSGLVMSAPEFQPMKAYTNVSTRGLGVTMYSNERLEG